ncbi:MAG: diaminopimelate decarboxylase [Longimicrobiales bacterium]
MDPFHYADDQLHCERVAAERLVGEYGTPLYVYSRGAIEERYREFDTAFAPLDRLIAFSVKANGNLSVLRLLARLGAGADIVSGGELHRVRAAGIPTERVLFSGVGKTIVEMAAALAAEIYSFNVESEGELRELAGLARTLNRSAPFALRVNPAIESPTPHHYTRTGHAESKFGIPIGDAVRLYRLAGELGGLTPVGIDVHIGSQILQPEPYEAALLQTLEIVDALHGEGIVLEYLDLGGGFGIAYEDESHHETPPARRFADLVVPHLQGRGLRLVLEPGRFIVGPAGILLTRVLYVKEMGSRTYIITDAGMNDLLRPSHYASYHAVRPARLMPGRERITLDIVGPICESGDFLALDRPLERPEPGELLAIFTTGAYGFSMASTYNQRPRPAEVLVEGENARLVRPRERYDDLLGGEVELLEA